MAQMGQTTNLSDAQMGGKEHTMSKHIPERHKEYLRIAKQALQDTYGFSPAMSDIVLLETEKTNGIVYFVAFAVGGKGYRWSLGWPVERAECYDLGQQG